MANNTSRVTDELRQLILSGDLEPAERLRADALAKRMGTSRTPVREALLVLEREGLVANLPNRGAMVRAFDGDDLLDLYEVRAVLEPHAARRAASRTSDEDLETLARFCDESEAADGSDKRSVERQILLNNAFHGVIVTASASPRLLEALRGNAGIPVDFRSAFWSNDDQRHRSFALHREILWGIQRRDANLAETAMRLHLEQARRFLEEVIEEGGLGAPMV
jgi:DNA-binding GntR family transcriptional regulator